ncbi:HNH endonuclease [Rufibacter glacialis]|uniref:HNH endonuclease n=1 Tax=Rufibacter glacialis TaxID=1259555 RepID=A0A5M8QEY3_9BACT|nr:HNH endonuclease [Rufibacter glacialis]KAA6433490.1 restriction endonuclease [Rufibacter glacialis]GGK73738.1 HNH endonuclease [Rufibacter glacialis]
MPAPQESLTFYLQKFTRLRQGVTKFGPAPHKAILLLSIIEQFEKGEVHQNQIFISPELVGVFKENFALLVTTGHNPDFFLPFYYLASEGFWFVKTLPGKELNAHIKSFHVLNGLVDYAYLAEDLYALLLLPETRHHLKTALLKRYFPASRLHQQVKSDGGYLHNLEKYILNESPAIYTPLQQTVPDEEQVFVRGGLFKKLVPQVYNFTCCITGMRLISNHGFSMVDACHIVPFSRTSDDRVTNGLALCPNLHRAFDRGLITIDPQLKVVVSPSIAEDEANAYALKKLAGKRLNLPFGAIHYPAPENLAWHREKVFKG